MSVITLKMSVLVEKLVLLVSITRGAQEDQQRHGKCAVCLLDLLNSGQTIREQTGEEGEEGEEGKERFISQ